MTTKTRPATCVYFLKCSATGLVKIGVAADLERRLAGLRAQSPVPLELLASMPAVSYAVESELHRRFAEHRDHGEWFSMSDGLEDLIRSLGGLADGVA